MNNNLTSLIAFKDRGNFGDNKYRGNCSGKVIQALLRHFRPQFVADFMRGSDTTGDVCKYENIKHKTGNFDDENDDLILLLVVECDSKFNFSDNGLIKISK